MVPFEIKKTNNKKNSIIIHMKRDLMF